MLVQLKAHVCSVDMHADGPSGQVVFWLRTWKPDRTPSLSMAHPSQQPGVVLRAVVEDV